MHPLERLLNLVILLLDTPRPLTFAQIREKLPAYAQDDVAAAKRMFERDKDVLRDLGVPVELSHTDVWEVEEGYTIPKDRYYLPAISFTPEELSALYVAAQAVGSDDEAERAVLKLRVGAEEGVVPAGPGHPLAASPDVPRGRLGAVLEATLRRRSVRFDYRPAAGDPGGRHVDPYALVSRAGHWYLVGLDRDRDAFRSFRLSRMLSDPADAGPGSEPPEGFDARAQLRLAPWGPEGPEGQGEPEERARMAFSPRVAWWAVRALPGAPEVRTRKDGWSEVEVPAPETGQFLSFLLSFGPDARVLAPRRLRDEVVRRLESVLAGG
jgi:proteasome accessory factor B